MDGRPSRECGRALERSRSRGPSADAKAPRRRVTAARLFHWCLPAKRSFDLDEFEQQCLKAFREYPPEKLTGLFDAKQRVCKCILESASVPGQNDYKLTRGNRVNE